MCVCVCVCVLAPRCGTVSESLSCAITLPRNIVTAVIHNYHQPSLCRLATHLLSSPPSSSLLSSLVLIGVLSRKMHYIFLHPQHLSMLSLSSKQSFMPIIFITTFIFISPHHAALIIIFFITTIAIFIIIIFLLTFTHLLYICPLNPPHVAL